VNTSIDESGGGEKETLPPHRCSKERIYTVSHNVYYTTQCKASILSRWVFYLHLYYK